MKLLSIILLTFILCSFDGFELQKEGKYSKEFQAISTALPKTKTLTAEFTQKKKIKVLKRPLKSSGKLIFDRSTGVFWKLQKPYASTIIIDNEKLTSIDDEGKKIVIKAEDKPMLYGFTKIFLSIFSGDTNELKEHFEIYFTKKESGWEIGLKPKVSELKKVMTRILLQGDNDSVKAITLWEANGDQTDISFSNITKAEKLSAEDKKKFEL